MKGDAALQRAAGRAQRAFAATAAAAMRWRWAVLALYLALAAASGVYAARTLTVETSPVALISPEVPWRARALDFREHFPHLQNTIVIVIDGATPEAAEQAQQRLRDALGAAADWEVWAPGSEAYLQRNGMLLQGVDRLDRMAEALVAAQPLIGAIAADPSLGGLFDLLRQAAENGEEADALAPALARMREAVAALNAGEAPAPLSWQKAVMGSETMSRSGNDSQRFVIVKPDGFMADRESLALVRSQLDTLGPFATASITGAVPLWTEEMDAAMAGGMLSGLVALLAVTVLLTVGLRSPAMVLASLLSLLAGLALTLGYATVAVGRLNIISVGFSALYIGLAIDFSVHLCARGREFLASGHPLREAFAGAADGAGGALALSALTAAAAFFSFAPTRYDGVAELGIIAGGGMIIGLVTSLTLLPALLSLLPAPTASGPLAVPAAVARVSALGYRHPRAVRSLSVLLAVGCLLAVPLISFDYNPMHLKPADSESHRTYEALSASGRSPINAQVLAEDGSEAEALKAELEALPQVARVVWLGSFIPADQDEKLAILDGLYWSVGFALPEDRLQLAPVAPERDVPAIRQAAAQLRDSDLPEAPQLAAALDAWLERWQRSDAAAREQQLERLRAVLLGNVPPLLDRLREMLSAQPVTLDDVPADLQSQWRSAEGSLRLQVEPEENLDDNRALLDYVEAVAKVAPGATSTPMEYVYSSRTIIEAFLQSFLLAAVAVTLLLLVLLRSLADTLRALVPLALGSLLLVAFMVAVGLEFNFANVVVLPLLLGISVANGVHIIWRARQSPGADPIATGTGRAVLISVATTLASFAALWLSEHRGMSSIGALLSIGLSLQLLCTFIVLPSLLPAARSRAQDRDEAIC